MSKQVTIKSSIVSLAGLIMALVLMVPTPSFACNYLPDPLCNATDPFALIGVVANWMVGIFGAIFVLMMIISGVQVASAGDSPDRLKAAKKRLFNAVLSLVLLISMRAIMSLLGIAI